MPDATTGPTRDPATTAIVLIEHRMGEPVSADEVLGALGAAA